MRLLSKLFYFIKEKKGYILSFCFPILIMTLLLLMMHVINGENLFICSDAEAQYYSLLCYLQDVFHGEASLSYSFNVGLGQGMLSTVAYYLISPFNFLVAFTNRNGVEGMMILITLLKLGMIGLTMFYYLKKTFDKKVNDIILFMFAMTYALSSFVMLYYINIIWLDVIYLFPLVMFGIDKIINQDKPLLYGVTLFLSILCNYYMGYIVCLFSVIYFLYKLFLKYDYKKDKKVMIKCFINYGITSLLFGFMTFFIMYPNLISLLSGNRIQNPNAHFFNEVTSLFSKIFIGTNAKNELVMGMVPLLYAGTIITVLSILYFCNTNISKKEKYLSFLIILFFLATFLIYPLYIFVNAFISPRGFAFRYAYILIFFLIILSVKSFINIKGVAKKHFIWISLLLPIYSIYVGLQGYEYITLYNLIITDILYLFYIFFLYLLSTHDDKKEQKYLKIFIVVLTIVELFFNAYLCERPNKMLRDEKDMLEDYLSVMVSKVNNIKENEEESFYRYGSYYYMTHIDSLIYKHPSSTVFLSTINNAEMSFMSNAGFDDYNNSYIYERRISPILESILSIKYMTLNSDDRERYEEVDKFKYSTSKGMLYGLIENELTTYKNPYALNLGYMISQNAFFFANLFVERNEITGIAYQDLVLETMSGSEERLFKTHDYTKVKDNEWVIKVTDASDLYLCFNYSHKDAGLIEIYVNGNLARQYGNNTSIISDVLKINNVFEVGNEITVSIKSNKEMLASDLYVYTLNWDVFEKDIAYLKENQLTDIEYRDGYVKGRVIATEDKPVLFTSIPFEKGWDVLVDGKKANYVKLYDSFGGVILEPGEHEVEFTYHTPFIKTGLIISLISLIMFIIYYWKRNIICEFLSSLYVKFEEIILYLIVGVLTTVVSVASYAVLAKTMGINYMISTVLSWIIAVTFAYVANKKCVFKSKLNTKKELIKEAYEFYKFRIISLIMEVILMYLMVSILSINDIISKIVINIVIIIANYVFSKLFIFRK